MTPSHRYDILINNIKDILIIICIISIVVYIVYFKRNVVEKYEVKSDVNLNGNLAASSVKFDSISFETSVLKDVLNKVYPVGSIYYSKNKTNPEELFGFGEWTHLENNTLIKVATASEDKGLETNTYKWDNGVGKDKSLKSILLHAWYRN